MARGETIGAMKTGDYIEWALPDPTNWHRPAGMSANIEADESITTEARGNFLGEIFLGAPAGSWF